ncbi:MAG: macrolide 2'-phosphotransferase [Egibacteraceae bacterium]
MTSARQDQELVADLAGRHGLKTVADRIVFNEIGLDYRVAFASTADGTQWVLRIPRRSDVIEGSMTESRILALVRRHLPVQVPDWRIHSDELIAYPLLSGTPGVTLDAQTGELRWNFDKHSAIFAATLGQALAALHAIDHEEARAAGLRVLRPVEVRAEIQANIDKVKGELEVADDLLRRWQAWLADESFWPEHSTVIHGDLHVGHVLVDADARATGILDWTEARVADPATDFMVHLHAFGDEGLEQLLAEYEKAGGRTWPRLKDHCAELLSAFAVNYALWALNTNNQEHLQAARTQLQNANAS